ncbi:hypothetical protein EE612_059798, partial [Oryza sativa]
RRSTVARCGIAHIRIGASRRSAAR